MSRQSISRKITITDEYYFCDICKKKMHPTQQDFEKGGDARDIHTDKFDAHVKCFEKLIVGDVGEVTP